MPHHKQFKKTLRKDAKRRTVNRARRARLRHALRVFRSATEAKTAAARFPEVVSILDKSAKTRLIHPRTADRLKARLAAHLQRLQAGPA